ncbi:MAG TPA: HAMP domain-containing sensor histidine kinase [Nitrososphaeraceae archaeon]
MKKLELIKLSTIRARIAILIFIQIVFIIISFIILSYYQSQVIYLENSINIADKNRFLTANLMLKISEYILEGSNDVSKINSAINQLESNILTLGHNGKVSDIPLALGSPDFLEDWNIIYQKWVSLKSILINNIIKPNEKMSKVMSLAGAEAPSSTIIDKAIKTKLEPDTLSLLNSSNELITDLDEFAKDESQNSILIQRIIEILNIVVIAAFVLYFVIKILRPVFALTDATSEVIRGNLNVSVRSKGNDELSVLSNSFNSMMKTIKNFVKKQGELTKKLEKANEELVYKDRLKDEVINLTAHELQGPIQPILGLLEILREKQTEIGLNIDEKKKLNQVEILDIIIRNSKRIRYIVDEILDVARIENGNLKLEKSKFNLNEEIKNGIKDLITEKDMENQIIRFAFQPKESIIVFADKMRIYQVISNLIRNALKFIPRIDSKIEISLEKVKNDREFVTAIIKDNGKGIDSEILPRLFEKFATKSDKGIGLGLYISRNIIEAHGGTIRGYNNPNGNGAIFEFTLPIEKK